MQLHEHAANSTQHPRGSPHRARTKRKGPKWAPPENPAQSGAGHWGSASPHGRPFPSRPRAEGTQASRCPLGPLVPFRLPSTGYLGQLTCQRVNRQALERRAIH